VALQVYTFSVTGAVSYGPGGAGADGEAAFASNVSAVGGISGHLSDRNFMLVGVFVSASEPADPPPATLDFTGNHAFPALSPALNQLFQIGDGLTGTGSGMAQQFTAPAGATRLFLGFVDASNFIGGAGHYQNNSGSLSVTVGTTAPACTDGPITTWSSGTGANNHQYQVKCRAAGITWTAAKADAEALGGHLAAIRDGNENAFIAGLTTAIAWVGGFQPSGSAEPGGGWSWVTNEGFGYSSWRSGEPNNCFAPACGPEDAMTFNDFGAGNWNDLPASATVGAYIVEWEPACNQAAQQWPAASGGNNHYYQLVCTSAGITFDAARTAAMTAGGYLASITSSAENDFAFNVANQEGGWLLNSFNCAIGPWLGGYQTSKTNEPAGNWAWVNGDAWGYTNWAGGEPNNSGNTEDAAHFYGCGGVRNKLWNDITNTITLFGYVIEYDSAPVPPASCSTGPRTTWSRNGHHYQVICAPGSGVDFFEAQESAAALGGYLAELNTAAENAFVFGLADHAGFWRNDSGKLKGPWLGAWYRNSNPAWVWLSGVGWIYTAWAAGEPAGDPFVVSRLQYGSANTMRSATWANVGGLSLQRAYIVEWDDGITGGPNTVIDSASVGTTSATFRFRDPNTTRNRRFECQLDGRAWSACTSPGTYIALGTGDHLFRVRSIDTVTGLADLTPAEHRFAVRGSGVAPLLPDTAIITGPTHPTSETTATFTFQSTMAGATFECALDGSAFGPCTSPSAHPGLAIGEHTFRVRSRSGALVDPSPATWIWVVAQANLPPPTQTFEFRAGSFVDRGVAFAWDPAVGSGLSVQIPGGQTVSCIGRLIGRWLVCWILGPVAGMGEYVASAGTLTAHFTYAGPNAGTMTRFRARVAPLGAALNRWTNFSWSSGGMRAFLVRVADPALDAFVMTPNGTFFDQAAASAGNGIGFGAVPESWFRAHLFGFSQPLFSSSLLPGGFDVVHTDCIVQPAATMCQ
jgi:hypothetical protein